MNSKPCLPTLAAVAFAMALPTLALAQRTVVVDANNGPGTDHTTISAALLALQNGDVIVVRAGIYDGAAVSTTHSFVLLGEGGPIVRPVVGAPHTLDITLASKLQRVTIKSLTIQSEQAGQWALRVRSNFNVWPAPTVHVEDCTIESVSLVNDRVGLLADTVGLTMQRCDATTTQLIDCVAAILDSTLRGADAVTNGGIAQRPLGGLDVLNSEVWIGASTIRAGSSASLDVEPASALAIIDNFPRAASRIRLCGATTLHADPAPHARWPVPPVVVNYAPWLPTPPAVDHEASVAFVPAPGGVVFSSGITVTVRTIPWLDTSAATPGGTLAIDVHGAAGDTGAALLGFATFPQRVLGSPVFVALTPLLTAGIATIPGSATVAFPVPIPSDPTLRGLTVEVMGLTAAANGALSLTNPAATTID